jgi:hypothetical protein
VKSAFRVMIDVEVELLDVDDELDELDVELEDELVVLDVGPADVVVVEELVEEPPPIEVVVVELGTVVVVPVTVVVVELEATEVVGGVLDTPGFTTAVNGDVLLHVSICAPGAQLVCVEVNAPE